MPKRADRNQPQIVRDLRRAGLSVQMLHTVGKGCPDILVGHQGMNWLFEIKDLEQPPSRRRLTDDEDEWHSAWKGQVSVAMTADEIIKVVEETLDGLYWGETS